MFQVRAESMFNVKTINEQEKSVLKEFKFQGQCTKTDGKGSQTWTFVLNG